MEEKADLEALHDINEEMQENARQGDNTHNNITAAGLQSRRRPPPPFLRHLIQVSPFGGGGSGFCYQSKKSSEQFYII